MEKNTPEKKFKAGAVTATVWQNPTEKGAYRSVSLSRSYKNGNEWKNSASLRLNDLPKAVLALNMAYEFLVMNVKDEHIEIAAVM